MFHTSSTNECSFCQQISWPMYTVRAIYDNYRSQYSQHRHTPPASANELSEPLTACPTCLYSRDDLIEWYANDPLCQQMDLSEIDN